jgi:hypothetical protein
MMQEKKITVVIIIICITSAWCSIEHESIKISIYVNIVHNIP